MWQEEVEWQEQSWETEDYETSKGKKGKGKRSEGHAEIDHTKTVSDQTPRNDRTQPKAKRETRSCMTNDFLFAMMSTKSKPTWRHSHWNGTGYVICTVAEPQKKLPIFKTGKWSLMPTVEFLSMDMMPRV